MNWKRNKRPYALLLSLVLLLALAPTALAAGRFTDVPESAWYCKDVAFAVENGLVNGTTPTTYAPDSDLTYGAAVKLAACMHKRVTQGSTDFTSSTPWYQTYVDYARDNGIITEDYAWNDPATRAGYIKIFANAIPDKGLLAGYQPLKEINRVDDNTIPDVSLSHPQAAAIYKLYRAGILQGNDAAHSCNPTSAIKRSEVAAILTRMMDADQRISFAMTLPSEPSTPSKPSEPSKPTEPVTPSEPTEPSKPSELTITTQPVDAAPAGTGTADFNVAVSGGKAPYSYRWFYTLDPQNENAWIACDAYPFEEFSGALTDRLTVLLDISSAILSCRCEVADAAGTKVTSDDAKFILSGADVFAEDPADLYLKGNGNMEYLTVTPKPWCSGDYAAAITYRWQYRNPTDTTWQYCTESIFTDTETTSMHFRDVKLRPTSLRSPKVGWSFRCEATIWGSRTVYSEVAHAYEAE